MPGVLHADLLAHLRKPAHAVHWLFELDLPTETLRLSTTGVASRSLGNYPAWVRSMGELNRSLSTWRGGLEAPSLAVEIDDAGGQFTRRYGRAHRGRPARCKLVGPDSLGASTHFTWFSGVVDVVSKNGQIVVFGLRMRDDQLQASAPRSFIRPNVFTSLPPDTDLVGRAIPYIVGHHDSNDLAARGMVLCRYVGSPGPNRYLYLVSSGWWLTVVRVLSDGVEMASPADYEVLTAVTGDSRRVLLLQFKLDQADKEVLADVQDLQSASGPCAVLRQTLADLYYGDSYGTHVDPTLAPVDAAAASALDGFLAGPLGVGRSYEIPPDRRNGIDVLSEFVSSYDVSCYWGYDAKLRFIPWELRDQNARAYLGPGAEDTGLATRQVLRPELHVGEVSYKVDAESEIARVVGKSGRRASDGSWLNTRTVVVSPGDPMERTREIELPWLPASAESIGSIAYMIAESSSSVSGFTAVGAASIHAAVAQGPPPADAASTIYALSDTSASIGAGTAQFLLALSNVPEFVAGRALTLWLTFQATNATSGDEDELRAILMIGGTPYASQPVVGAGPGKRRAAMITFQISPATSAPFTRSELNGASLLVEWIPGAGAGTVSPTKRIRIMQAYASWSYTAAANVSPALLAMLSRAANRYLSPPEVLSIVAPLSFLDYDLGDDVPLEDSREGWGGQPWSRARGRVVGMRVGPGVGGVGLDLELVDRQLTTLWLQGRALAGVDGASAAGDGMALLVPGAMATVERQTVKYLDAPAGIGVQPAGPVVRILANCWPSERRGTHVERSRQNELVRSSFVSGLAGLAQSSGSGSIAVDTTVGEQLFVDGTVTPQHCILTSGSPHNVETRLTWPSTGNVGLGADYATVSVDYRCSTTTIGDGPAWRLVRVADGFAWNDAAGAWQAGPVDNPLTPALAWTRSTSKPVPIVAGKSRAYTFSVALPAGGTAARWSRIGHVQLECSADAAQGTAQWRSSRIVTDAAAPVTRDEDRVRIAGDTPRSSSDATVVQTIPNVRGALWFHVRPDWSSANVTAGQVFTVYTLRFDADNAWSLAFVVGAGWRWRARAGGFAVVESDAVINASVTAGEEYEIACRWTSALGEWGRPLTLTLVVRRLSDGALLGQTEVSYTAPIATTGASVGIGYDTSAAGQQFSGYIIGIRESPFPPSDEAMLTSRFTPTGD